MKIGSLLFISFFLLSCVGTKVVMNPNYSGKDLTNRELLIFPIINGVINVTNPKDVKDDFPEDEREVNLVIRDNFMKVLFERTQNDIQNISVSDFNLSNHDLGDFFNKDSYSKVLKKIGDDNFPYEFYIPKKVFLKKLNCNPDIVYVINKITFKRFEGSAGTWSGGIGATATYSGGKSSSLYSEVKFIIWDYQQNNAIGYGEFEVGTSFVFAMTNDTWATQFNRIVKTMFKKTPFHLKPII
jgi:uncharacterized protein YehS (DUF1456 family)